MPGSGLLERYNFTIREDTPFDVDVAVDPEMLGKVYESLIQEEERGKVGIFYTPRIEVDFMCRQSLLEYVIEQTGISHDKLISFIYAPEGDRADLLSEEEAQKIGNALYNAQIVDPACGSGAFLVGMLHVLMELYSQILKRRNKRLNLFKTKKEIISNNLYGADIKDWAVRVAELRMWLTLLVETPDSEIKLNAKKPLLPNLTLKLRCGDSLVQEIGCKPLRLRAMMTHLHPICKTGITDLYKKLREDKKNYYYSRADDPDVLAKIKRKEVKIVKTLVDSEIKRIDFLLKPLAATQQRFDYTQTAITTSEKKRTEDKLKLDKEKERLNELLETLKSGELRNKFFWEIDFAEVFADGGFDIVIANPPYVRQEKIAPQDIPEEEITKELRQEYKAALVRSVTAQWGDEFKKDLKSDLYVYFYYLALSLLKPRGVFCFISSNSWLDVGFGAKLQAFLLRNIETKEIYDNHAKRTFAEADINTIIVVFKRPKEKVLTENLTRFVAFKKPFEVVIDEGNLKAIASAREKLKTDDFRCVTLTQGELWNDGVAGEETKQAEITGSEFIGNYAGNKWGGKYLRAPDIFFTILEKGKGKLVRLGDVAEVLTVSWSRQGQNAMLMVDKSAGIPEVEVVDVLKSPRDVSKINLKHADTHYFLKLLSQVKDQLVYAPLLWVDLRGFKHLCHRCLEELAFTHNFHGIRPFKDELTEATVAGLNSTLVWFFIEVLGRRGLGGGAIRVLVEDLRFQFPVPNPSNIQRQCSLTDLKQMETRRIGNVFEECGIDPNKEIREQEPNPLPDRAELDNIIFDELGLTEEERKEVYWSVCELVKQRLEKARSLRK